MLSYTRIGDRDAARWITFAHGILGSGKNLRSFARKLGDRTGWGAISVDLRMHGDSRGFAPPHTIEAAAGDVLELIEALGREGTAVAALCGHSFGGKVLSAARPRIDGLRATWLIDSSPSRRPGAMDESEPTAAVVALRALEAIGDRFADRDAFTGALSDRGLSEPVAAWLALNLERRDGGFELALDLAAIRALLADYFATGTWSTLEGGGVVDVAIAGKGSALDAGDQRRLAELERRGAVRCHRFEDAGHWIHVDDPDGLLEAIAASLG